MDAFLARAFSPQEVARLTSQTGTLSDSQGVVTAAARRFLPALGARPTRNGAAPGVLGAEVVPLDEGAVRVRRIQPGSAAERAGLRVGDRIDFVNGAWPMHALELRRMVRPTRVKIVVDRDPAPRHAIRRRRVRPASR